MSWVLPGRTVGGLLRLAAGLLAVSGLAARLLAVSRLAAVRRLATVARLSAWLLAVSGLAARLRMAAWSLLTVTGWLLGRRLLGWLLAIAARLRSTGLLAVPPGGSRSAARCSHRFHSFAYGRRVAACSLFIFSVLHFAAFCGSACWVPAGRASLRTHDQPSQPVGDPISSRISRAASDGVLPTRTPAASNACCLAWAVPDEPDTIAPACPMVLPSGAVNPAT